MQNASTLIKLSAIAVGFVIGVGTFPTLTARPAASQTGVNPTASPASTANAPAARPTSAAAQPATTAQPQATAGSEVTVHGIACVDLDHNGICSYHEARVPDVIVRDADGAIAVTNNAGEYTLQTPGQSELFVTIPSGFTSINGNLRHLSMQMFSGDKLDIALDLDGALPASVDTANQVESRVNSILPFTEVPDDLKPIYLALAGVAVVVLLMLLLSARVMSGMRYSYQTTMAQQDKVLRDQYARELSQQFQSNHGWPAVAGQIVADALRETVSINGDAGILDITVRPSPRFTLITRDGREVVFTTDPRVMRKVKLIRRGDRVVDVSALSPTSRTEAAMLWEYVLGAHNMSHAAAPSSAHWYVVVRSAGARASGKRGIMPRRLPRLTALRQFALLRGGRG
jgi:hypothetical protein